MTEILFLSPFSDNLCLNCERSLSQHVTKTCSVHLSQYGLLYIKLLMAILDWGTSVPQNTHISHFWGTEDTFGGPKNKMTKHS